MEVTYQIVISLLAQTGMKLVIADGPRIIDESMITMCRTKHIQVKVVVVQTLSSVYLKRKARRGGAAVSKTALHQNMWRSKPRLTDKFGVETC